jgi:hypothetical protein
MSSSDTKREPFQFRLQTLLLLVAIVALGINAILLTFRCRRLSVQCEEANVRLQVFRREAEESRRIAYELQEDANILKNLMGFPATDTVSRICEQFDLDMNTFAADVPPQDGYYRTLWLRMQQRTAGGQAEHGETKHAGVQ